VTLVHKKEERRGGRDQMRVDSWERGEASL